MHLSPPSSYDAATKVCGVIDRPSFGGRAAVERSPSPWRSQEWLQLGPISPMSLGLSRVQRPGQMTLCRQLLLGRRCGLLKKGTAQVPRTAQELKDATLRAWEK